MPLPNLQPKQVAPPVVADCLGNQPHSFTLMSSEVQQINTEGFRWEPRTVTKFYCTKCLIVVYTLSEIYQDPTLRARF